MREIISPVPREILCGWTAAVLGRLSFHTSMEATDAVSHLCDRCRDHGPREFITLFASLELSKSKLVVTINSPGGERFSIPSMGLRAKRWILAFGQNHRPTC